MKGPLRGLLPTVAALALLAVPAGAGAQLEPEKLEVPAVGSTFAVLMTYEDGTEGTVFNSKKPLVLDINFVLAMSASNTYPLTLTLIQDAGGEPQQTVIWKGTLEEGFYRLRYPVGDLPAGGGPVAAKVVMKVRIFEKRYTGQSSSQYTTWEGTYEVGKIR